MTVKNKIITMIQMETLLGVAVFFTAMLNHVFYKIGYELTSQSDKLEIFFIIFLYLLGAALINDGTNRIKKKKR